MIGPRTTFAVIGSIVAFVLIVGGIIVGGWQANWWFANSGTNHQAHINSSSYGAQESDLSLIASNMQAINGDEVDLRTAPAGLAQQIHTEILGDANNVCHYDTLLTGSVALDPQTAAFVKANCLGGSVSALSSLRNGT